MAKTKSKLEGTEIRSFDSLSSRAEKSTASVVQKKEEKEEYIRIPLDNIIIESNIRTQYDDEEIRGLAESMEQYGQLEPIRVYEQLEGYAVIFGHRRLLAAQHLLKEKRGPLDIKCIVTSKPDTLDNLYIQAIENEHSVNLSSADREKYITDLHKKHGQSVAEIAKKLGKSEPWIYAALNAKKIRTKHEDIFNNAGITLTTGDTQLLANVTPEEVQTAVNMIVENPDKKTKILKELQQTKAGKKTSNKKTTPKENFLNTLPGNDTPEEPAGTDDISIPELDADTEGHEELTDFAAFDNLLKESADLITELKIEVVIQKNDVEKTVQVMTNNTDNINLDNIVLSFIDNIIDHYKNEGYNIM